MNYKKRQSNYNGESETWGVIIGAILKILTFILLNTCGYESIICD